MVRQLLHIQVLAQRKLVEAQHIVQMEDSILQQEVPSKLALKHIELVPHILIELEERMVFEPVRLSEQGQPELFEELVMQLLFEEQQRQVFVRLLVFAAELEGLGIEEQLLVQLVEFEQGLFELERQQLSVELLVDLLQLGIVFGGLLSIERLDWV